MSGSRARIRARLGVFVLAGACVAAGTLASGATVAAGPAPERPNVVVIMSDDQEANSLRVMEQTKRLLTRRGVKFSRHYATFPLCCPSRASYLTGQFSHNHGVQSNTLPDGGFQRFDDSATLPVSLAAAGYRTGWIGKYLNGYPGFARANPTYIPPGWETWFVGLTGRMFNWYANDGGVIKLIERGASTYQTDVYAREGRRFIRSSLDAGVPFFVTIAPLAPHGEPKRSTLPNPRPAPRHKGAFDDEPFPTPDSFNELDVEDKPSFVSAQPRLDSAARQRVRGRYRSRLASLLAVDDLVADVVGDLKKAGALRNTYIFFTSDNGFLLGHHRLVGKSLLYEESAKVPMVIRGPGLPHGTKHEQLTANVDLMPTILELAQASAQAPVDGISMLPAALDPGASTGRVVLLESRRSAGVENGRYVYLEHDTGGDERTDEYEFYDLATDPRQVDNLHLVDAPSLRAKVVAARPELLGIRDSLARRLAELRDCQGAACH